MRKPKIKFNQIKPNSLAATILRSIGKTGGLYLVYSKNKKEILHNLDCLRKRGLIKQKDKYKIDQLMLTKEGFIEFLKLELIQTDLLPKGKECMVTFDVPEISKSLRKVLTIFLEESCFIRLQKSVWISPFDAAKRLVEIFYLSGITKWVKVFTVEEAKSLQNKDVRPYSV